MSATTESPLPELESQLRTLARRARRVAAERGAAVHPELGELGYVVLEHVQRFGPTRQSDVVAGLASEKAAVSRTVAQLVELGYVERRPDPDDKRAGIVALTDEGRSRIESVLAESRARAKARLVDISSAELAQLAALLARYNAAMEA